MVYHSEMNWMADCKMWCLRRKRYSQSWISRSCGAVLLSGQTRGLFCCLLRRPPLTFHVSCKEFPACRSPLTVWTWNGKKSNRTSKRLSGTNDGSSLHPFDMAPILPFFEFKTGNSNIPRSLEKKILDLEGLVSELEHEKRFVTVAFVASVQFHFSR